MWQMIREEWRFWLTLTGDCLGLALALQVVLDGFPERVRLASRLLQAPRHTWTERDWQTLRRLLG
ncbi:hypothetical protein [Nitrospira sp. Kam-Ns4a]